MKFSNFKWEDIEIKELPKVCRITEGFATQADLDKRAEELANRVDETTKKLGEQLIEATGAEQLINDSIRESVKETAGDLLRIQNEMFGQMENKTNGIAQDIAKVAKSVATVSGDVSAVANSVIQTQNTISAVDSKLSNTENALKSLTSDVLETEVSIGELVKAATNTKDVLGKVIESLTC